MQGLKLGVDRDDIGDGHPPTKHAELERTLRHLDVWLLAEHVTVGLRCRSKELRRRTIRELCSIEAIESTRDTTTGERHKRLYSLNQLVFSRGKGRRDRRHHARTFRGRPQRSNIVGRLYATGNVQIPADHP